MFHLITGLDAVADYRRRLELMPLATASVVSRYQE
jgi:hypothetical protein